MHTYIYIYIYMFVYVYMSRFLDPRVLVSFFCFSRMCVITEAKKLGAFADIMDKVLFPKALARMVAGVRFFLLGGGKEG